MAPVAPVAPVAPWCDLLVLDLVLHEDRLQLVALGEALQLLVGDGAHQGGLAALVGAQQAVETSTEVVGMVRWLVNRSMEMMEMLDFSGLR